MVVLLLYIDLIFSICYTVKRGENMFSVIFDMDGTLLDTQKICIPAWEDSGIRQGIVGVGNDVVSVCGMNETGWTNFLSEKYPNLDIPRFKQEMREYIIRNGVVRFKEGAGELLDYLKDNNIKIAIASGSSKETIHHHLSKVDALNKFDAIVGGRDVKNGKPSPDIFLKAAELLYTPPENCFVLEDSANGIIAGHKAGMKCIGIPDVVAFDSKIKKLMFKELSSLSQAISIFEEYQKKQP